MNRIRIDVTAEDIRLGIKSCCRHCPIANAAKRKFPETQVRVGDSRITVRPNVVLFTVYKTSKRLREFILAYDQGQEVKAGTYYITKVKVVVHVLQHDGMLVDNWSAG